MNKISRLSFACCLALALSIWPATLTYADAQDTFNAIAGIDWQHDDNLFRLPSGSVTTSKRADEVKSGYAGIRIDKLYALQHFRVYYTHTAYRYQNNHNLNFDTNEYQAAWLWALTPYLTGNLSTERAEGRDTSQDINGLNVFNVRRTENNRLDADWSPYSNWHLLTGLSHYKLSNSQQANAVSDYTQKSIYGGVRYVFSSGSAMSLITTGRKGSYDRRALIATSINDTGFGERELDASLNWILTAKSRLNLVAGYVSRDYDNFKQRNYDEPFGSAEYVWAPTSKLQISAIAARQITGYESVNSSFTVRDSLGVTPRWAITDKIALLGNASIANRRFRGSGIAGIVDREDTEKNASVSINWTPWRYVTLGANLQRSTRGSTLLGIDYKDTTAGVSAQLFF